MLGKILKYEFKATAHIYLLMFAALLVVAGINALLLPAGAINTGDAARAVATTAASAAVDTAYSFITGMSLLVYVTLVIANSIMVVVISVIRFYNLLGDQGYLWLTLPATVSTHVIGKLINSVIWFIASLIVMVLSMILLMAKIDWFVAFMQIWNWLEAWGIHVWLWVAALSVVAVVSYLANILMFYAAIAIGPNVTKSRLGGTVIVYIIIYVIEQAIATALMVPLVLIIGSQFGFDDSLPGSDISLPMQQATQVFSEVEIIGLELIGFTCVFSVIVGVVLCFFIRHFMTKKLNLT